MESKKKILFRLVAYTDAAGKFSVDAFRNGNEDNFYVDDDLTDNITNRVAQDEIIQLGKLGMIMVVADGMGGMNAGEIASQIAIDTVKNSFTTDSLINSVTATPQSRQKYLEQTIVKADKNIKLDSTKESSHEGMGSTIIIAWLFNNELSISWCGDSRAYIFNDNTGIRLISQDHSYVQDLVHKGILTYEQTFDHPQNNIITRSLGDPTKEAKPESKTINIGKGDIILLCSDGLSGVLRDRKTYNSNGFLYPENNIEDIIRANTKSMKECRRALWEAAEKEGWYDNVTAVLCQIIEGPESPWITTPIKSVPNNSENNKKKLLLRFVFGILSLIAIVTAFFVGRYFKNPPIMNKSELYDSISVEKDDSIVRDDSIVKRTNNINKISNDNSKVKENMPRVQQHIKEKSISNEDTIQKLQQNKLTKIKKNNKDIDFNKKIPSIKEKLKDCNSENPLTPTIILKNQSTKNSLNSK